jgi:hypothetical protein
MEAILQEALRGEVCVKMDNCAPPCVCVEEALDVLVLPLENEDHPLRIGRAGDLEQVTALS